MGVSFFLRQLFTNLGRALELGGMVFFLSFLQELFLIRRPLDFGFALFDAFGHLLGWGGLSRHSLDITWSAEFPQAL
jgi:hypothetical protein